MSVGILLITHGDIGANLLYTATRILGGTCPVAARTLAVTDETQRDLLCNEALRLASEVDSGDGVLVLADLYGSTPANIACSLQDGPGPIQIIAGLNLPMLVRALNYARLPLVELAAKAETGGRDGVLICASQQCAAMGAMP
ncbi:MAG: PTS fructose transporter subunit IIA [Chromatiaceae bacterium]